MKPKRKYKVFAVTSRNIHFSILRPVLEELLRRGWEVRILRLERLWEKVESFLSRTIKRRSLKSFYEETPRKGARRMMSWCLLNLAARLVFYLLNVFNLEKPDIIIVLTDSSPPCTIAVLVGKLSKIPSLLLLHVGIIGRNYECPEFLVDKIAVTGEAPRDILIKCGVEENKIVVTGRPTYDFLIGTHPHFDKDKICKRYNLDPAKKIIVYTTENLPPNENKKMVYAICRAVKVLGSQFIIKVHPSELDLSMYRRVTRDVGVDALITKDADLYEILYISDVIVTGFSATALDAMMLDKPVITVNLSGQKDPVPYAESGAAIGVYKEIALKEAIERALYDEDTKKKLKEAREKFIYAYSFKKDGKSTLRVIQLIERMVAEYDRYSPH